ncbi:MAG: hypothetical protein LUH14_02960 [Clostridiaceae bacterium]|nr:hypothetical protein [Clostridiaceae bacterium]
MYFIKQSPLFCNLYKRIPRTSQIVNSKYSNFGIKILDNTLILEYTIPNKEKQEEKIMAGYNGVSMSNNARAAYADGEKPFSKWSKTAMMEALAEVSNLDFSVLTKKEIFENLFRCSSWHHTGKFYNCTDFYSVDEEKASAATAEMISNIISSRPKRARRSADEIQKERDAKAARVAEKQCKEHLKMLFEKQTRYKRFSAFCTNAAYISECEERLEIATDEKIKELRKVWSAEKDQERRARLLSYLDDVDYIKRAYVHKI